MTTQSILAILNPVHLPTVSDKQQIAEAIVKEQTGGYLTPIVHGRRLLEEYRKFDKSFEELTRGKSVMRTAL